MENPFFRVEDVRAAVDFLTTLDIVDNERIGALGICAGGGYATSATLSDRRIKALGTVVGATLVQQAFTRLMHSSLQRNY